MQRLMATQQQRPQSCAKSVDGGYTQQWHPTAKNLDDFAAAATLAREKSMAEGREITWTQRA